MWIQNGKNYSVLKWSDCCYLCHWTMIQHPQPQNLLLHYHYFECQQHHVPHVLLSCHSLPACQKLNHTVSCHSLTLSFHYHKDQDLSFHEFIDLAPILNRIVINRFQSNNRQIISTHGHCLSCYPKLWPACIWSGAGLILLCLCSKQIGILQTCLLWADALATLPSYICLSK